MKLFKPTLFAYLSLYFAALSTTVTGEEARVPISLDSLALQAVVNNPEINFFEAEIAAAQGGRTTAGQLSNPNLSVAGGGKTTVV